MAPGLQRLGPADLAATEAAEGGVDDDALEPGPGRRLAPEPVALAVSGQVGLLGHVGGQGRIGADAQGRAVGARVGALVERPEVLDLVAKGHRLSLVPGAPVGAPTLQTRRSHRTLHGDVPFVHRS